MADEPTASEIRSNGNTDSASMKNHVCKYRNQILASDIFQIPLFSSKRAISMFMMRSNRNTKSITRFTMNSVSIVVSLVKKATCQSRVRHSVAIYGQILLFCDQSMREKAWGSRKRGA